MKKFENNRYMQTIYWPYWLTLLVLLFDLSIVLAVWASLGETAALTAFALTIALSIFFFQFTALKIMIQGDELFVGRARIERKYLGEISVLDKKEMLFLRGPGINPSAYMALRFWVKGGVKIELNDSRDPTPYWLISVKDPANFVTLLEN